ncbi:competence-damaged protein [Lucifera butyrica]|uniref:Putative competence-damage inducible protein n=1 Tax=Lucifera butyrica TaxID=1351585 RepID=A0A498R5B5_9FIRM|nr:competence/damage-inducible protein A [Lucifera butyrica]VBB06010.1 competence-damaged protein [Lucifera butyrica]
MKMIVEIITTGTELLLGQIINTNAPYLAQKLNEIGFSVLYQTTVGDNRERMRNVMKTALSRADIVITSGGLGPTQGDITKEVTALVLDRPLFLHEPSVSRIQNYFAKRHMTMPDNNLRQAMMPKGAIVVDNERGTAPGVITEADNKIIINLPGPPHELNWMFENRIQAYLQERFGSQGVIISKVLRTYGIGESSLEEKIKDQILEQNNPTIALLAREGEIHIRLTAKAGNTEEANRLIGEVESKMMPAIAPYLFGVNDETLENAVGQILQSKKLTIALAESCTGGLATSRLTDVPGSSAYLMGSIVSYSNEIKNKFLDVSEQILASQGAVSAETATAMACGVRKRLGTHIGVGITGIAGPGGATADKPVGLVFIAVDGSRGPRYFQYNFTGQRKEIKNRTAKAALFHIREYLLSL